MAGAGNFLLNNGGGLVLLNDGSSGLLLNDQSAKAFIVIIADETVVSAPIIEEETTGLIRLLRLKDEDGAQITLASLETVVCTVLVRGTTDTVLRWDECLNQNDVTITEDATETQLDFVYQVQDTRMVDRTIGVERHYVNFEFGHDSDSNGSATDIVSTTNDSSTVSVTITGHGLTIGSEGHHVFLNVADDIGGLTLKGTYRITSVVDANTIQIEANCNASSTVSNDGGLTEWWLNGKANKISVILPVRRTEPVC